MNDLNSHYRLLLGLNDAWDVQNVALDLDAKQVVIELQHAGGKLCCPECQQSCGKADNAPMRRWRHLDTMQFETIVEASVPRSKCPNCGTKTISVPWAAKHSRFTLMFEAFAIRVLQAASNVKSASEFLGLSWDTTHSLMERAVKRGLQRRQEQPIQYVGIDEKSFGSGQDYVSLMVDIDRSRVLEVAKDRTTETCNKLWSSLSEAQKNGVLAVATDFWQAYSNSTREQAPQAEIVHDRFHVSQYLVDAVDLVRRKENRSLKKQGDDSLVGTRQLWLFNLENLEQEEQRRISHLQRAAVKTSRAWGIKEMFRDFWTYRSSVWAKKFFDRWYAWAIRSRLKPIKNVAVMLKKHLQGLLAYFRHRITNAQSEGFNSRVQAIKSAARGFRSFENYRIRILFYCGKLDLLPETSH